MYTVDHNDIFNHMYFRHPGNLLNTKFQYLTKVVFNFKEAL